MAWSPDRALDVVGVTVPARRCAEVEARRQAWDDQGGVHQGAEAPGPAKRHGVRFQRNCVSALRMDWLVQPQVGAEATGPPSMLEHAMGHPHRGHRLGDSIESTRQAVLLVEMGPEGPIQNGGGAKRSYEFFS